MQRLVFLDVASKWSLPSNLQKVADFANWSETFLEYGDIQILQACNWVAMATTKADIQFRGVSVKCPVFKWLRLSELSSETRTCKTSSRAERLNAIASHYDLACALSRDTKNTRCRLQLATIIRQRSGASTDVQGQPRCPERGPKKHQSSSCESHLPPHNTKQCRRQIRLAREHLADHQRETSSNRAISSCFSPRDLGTDVKYPRGGRDPCNPKSDMARLPLWTSWPRIFITRSTHQAPVHEAQAFYKVCGVSTSQ